MIVVITTCILSMFKCDDCGVMLNADINGCVNIAKGLIGKQALFGQGASDGQARSVDDFRYNGMST